MPMVALHWEKYMQYILEKYFGIDGIWFSVVVAELVAAAMTVLFIAVKRGTYHY